jgi:hypothetical protein
MRILISAFQISSSRSSKPSRLPRLLPENSLHNAGADAELLADFEDAITAGPQL